MPCIPTLASARILEGLELEPFGGNTYPLSIGQQECSIGRDQMRHGPSLPDVAVHPQAAVHGVDHSGSTRDELAIREALATRS
jgi:hypothetical protein